jgi:N-formylglutamate amidohydrolase
MRRRTLILSAGWVCGLVRAAEAPAPVVSSRGTLPLILTVPHDGAQAWPGVPERTRGVRSRDAGTRALAEGVVALLERSFGQRPYLVIATLSRKLLDVNRPEREALESSRILPAYRAYHERIAAFIAEIRNQHSGRGLLVDVHGQGREPGTLFRGTDDGASVTSLVRRFGLAALQGPQSISGLMAAQGYRVHPPVDAPSVREDPRFDGGFTVQTYGSRHAGGIDAIQLEFGRALRESPRLAGDLAEALAVFMRRHALVGR